MLEKILERLEAEADFFTGEPMGSLQKAYYCKGVEKAKEIVQEVAKDGGWIPVEVAMPEEHESIFAKFKDTEKWDIGMFEKCSDDVNATVEYTDGTRKTKTLHTCDGIWKMESVYAQYTVIAWQPLPTPYQKGE